MPPYEALYGRRYRSPLHWDEVGEKVLLGPELVNQAVEKIHVVRQRMREAQDRYKSYADKRRRPLEFEVGEHVFLKVSPVKGVVRFGIKGKLSPRYVGPYEILERIGPMAYRLALPSSLSEIHNVFHVSQLRKCLSSPESVLVVHPPDLRPNLSYEEKPVRILDQKEKVLRTKTIRYVKMLWNEQTGKATWELKDEMKKKYPELF